MLGVVSNLSMPKETFFSLENSLQFFFCFFFHLNNSVEEDGSTNKRHGLVTCNEKLRKTWTPRHISALCFLSGGVACYG